MIITRLTIANFGVYRGQHEFDMRPRQVGDEFLPVVLFGGKNGSGKTTILEAIRLCLYGRSALGTRTRRVDYESYIRQRFHRGLGSTLPARSARVGLIFEHTHAGVLSTYDSVRSWHIEGETLHESTSIYKDGQPLREIAPEHWNDFLRDLIPPGVADLFFFDGEQIQSLAEEGTESSTLASAVGGLLNLDLVDRLKSDLSLYVKQQEQQERSLLRKTAEDVDSAYKALYEDFLVHKQNRAALVSQLDGVRKHLEDARQTLINEGVGFVENRLALEQRQGEVERNLEQTRATIRDLAADLMPFAVAPKWSIRLKERLEVEAQSEQTRLTYEAQKLHATEIALRLLDQGFQKNTAPDVKPQDWAKIARELQTILLPPEFTDMAILHPVSSPSRTQLYGWIDRALNEVPSELHELGEQLENLESERSQLQHLLKQIPEDAVANPLLEEFHNLSEAKGALQEQIRRADEILAQVDLQLVETDRQRKKAWQQLANAGDRDLRVERAAKVQVILDDYLRNITAIKIQELEKMVAHYFNLLCRKQMLVREVNIDPKRYVVTLYGENRKVIPKSSLSAGEKQLYAMSLLWALRSVSGRMLPIIVDTPMGRLDSDHRNTLLTQFFPMAAHQIILLSTDTEVDAEAYQLLQPAISHVFLLDYNVEQGCTTVEQRYFVDEAQEIAT